jgi:hypothetical protein
MWDFVALSRFLLAQVARGACRRFARCASDTRTGSGYHVKGLKLQIRRHSKGVQYPDHLASLASQALASLRLRNQRSIPISTLDWIDSPIQVDSAVDAKIKPDLSIQIGNAEDGLPLILNIRRSNDTGEAFALKDAPD